MSVVGDTDYTESEHECNPDDRITVYMIAPHPYDADYDDLLTDDITFARSAAHDAIDDVFSSEDESGVISGGVTITQTTMSRGEYEMITEGLRELI